MSIQKHNLLVMVHSLEPLVTLKFVLFKRIRIVIILITAIVCHIAFCSEYVIW
jgi:hypothetical protein